MLTDSASSPPSSPQPMSDAMMPPPSLGPRRKGQQNYGAPEGFLNMAHGYPGLPDYSVGVDHAHAITPAHGNFFHGGQMSSMYSSQPSPLADRFRGLGAANMTGSPLRRQTLANNTGGASASKISTLSPVSSVRGSSLAGAMNVRVGSSGKRSRGLSNNGNATDDVLRNEDDGGGSGNLFAMPNSSANPFATSTSRGSPGQLQGAFGQQGQLMGGVTGYSPMRGSPLRLSMSSGKFAGGSPQRLNSSGGRSSVSSTSGPAAGVDLQNALSGAGLGSMGPALGGLGFGFTSTNITPSRITPNSRNKQQGGLMGPSPSPTVRRFQAQQQGGGWLEDPFDYQGALQHELENMGTEMTGFVGQQNGGGNGGGGGGANGAPAEALVASNYNPSPMKYGAMSAAQGVWYGGGHYTGFGAGSHPENVSAVRDGMRRGGGEGGDGASA